MRKFIIYIIGIYFIIFTVSYIVSCKKVNNKSTDEQKVAVPEESATTYKVDPKATMLMWKGSKPSGFHHGTILVKSGTISVEKEIITAGKFTIDMGTIKDLDLTDPKENKKLVDDLSSDNFFDVEKFPVSEFSITNALKLEKNDAAGNNYSMKGNLTLKDVTKNITIPAHVNINKEELTAKSKFSISRKEFKLKYAKGKIFKGIGDSIIDDTIEFNLELKATSAK